LRTPGAAPASRQGARAPRALPKAPAGSLGLARPSISSRLQNCRPASCGVVPLGLTLGLGWGGMQVGVAAAVRFRSAPGLPASPRAFSPSSTLEYAVRQTWITGVE
jgi:hypothetical protein